MGNRWSVGAALVFDKLHSENYLTGKRAGPA